MNISEYSAFTQAVAGFAEGIGLRTEGLFRDSYNPSEDKAWVISVSWKNTFGTIGVLYSEEDMMSPNFDNRLLFPLVFGSKRQIEEYKRIAAEKGAVSFSKKSIARNATIYPSPEFLALSPVEQVEYAIHEAFHLTPKTVICRKRKLPIPSTYDEASAVIAGHLGAVHYFRGTEHEPAAVEHWQKTFCLAGKVAGFWNELRDNYGVRIGEDGRPVAMEQKMIEGEEILARARAELGDELGGPINKAFFVYFGHYYRAVPAFSRKVEGIDDPSEIMKSLITFDLRV